MRGVRSCRLPWYALAVALAVCLAGVSPVTAADIQTITHGARVELGSHTVQGKLTLFDFYADWCGGCQQLEPVLQRYATRHADELAIRKVDIVRWDSPVASQFRLRSIPHLKLLDTDGAVLAEGDAGAVLAALDRELGVAGGGAGVSGGLVVFALVLAAVIVAGLLLGTSRRKAGPGAATALPPQRRPEPRRADPPAADPDAAPIWFAVMQGNLEGPFSIKDLQEMRRRSVLEDSCQVRRKGDAGWQTLGEVVGS